MSKFILPLTIHGQTYLSNKPSGDYGRDCDTGEMLATGALAHTRRENDPFLIGEVVQAIVSAGRYSGIEVGFFATIGAALSGAE